MLLNCQISLAAPAGAKAKFIYPLVAGGASFAVLYFPCMLSIHLEMCVNLLRHSLIVMLFFFGSSFSVRRMNDKITSSKRVKNIACWRLSGLFQGCGLQDPFSGADHLRILQIRMCRQSWD
jgi:hypothetical protein